MANRVNIKFVVILSMVMIVISGGVAFLAMRVLQKSADEHIRLGDTAMQAGDYRVASSHYSKAVANDQLNKVYLHKWVDALELTVPANEQLLSDTFSTKLVPAYKQLADADPDGVEDQLIFLNLQLDRLQRGGGYRADAYALLITEPANTYIEYHARTHPDDTSWWPLRRFNAIAMSLAATSGTAPNLEDVEAAIADGKAALVANPDDEQAAEAVYKLLVYRSNELNRQQLPGSVDARAEIGTFIADTIDRTTAGSTARMAAETTRLTNQMRELLRELKDTMTSDQAAIAMGQRVGELEPAMTALFDRIDQAKVAPDNMLIRRLMNAERGIAPRDGMKRSAAVIAAAIKQRPEDVELLKQRATLETITGDAHAAIATYRAIGEFRPYAINLESVLRKQYRIDALYNLAELLYTLADTTEDEAERADLLTQVKEVRDQLAERVASDTPQLQLIDARIALTEGKLVEAQAMLERLNRQTQFQFDEGLWLAGASAAKNHQPGLARTRFRQLVELQPGSVRYRRALAEMEQDVGNSAEALAQLRVALEIDPTNRDVRDDVKRLETAQGIRVADDPVDAALIEAKRISEGAGTNIADPRGAITRLEKAIEDLGPDARLVSNLTRQYVLSGRIEDAQRVAKAGLEAHPEDSDMILLGEAVDSGDRSQIIEFFLDQIEGEPGDVAVAKWLALLKLGETEAAERALQAAIELAPDNAAVLEARMVNAIRSGDLEQGATIAARAAQSDADGAGGATFLARVQRARGDTEDAIATLSEAKDRFPNSAGLWRLLGMMYAANNQPTESLAAYDRALEIRPDLVEVINSKIRILLALGQTQAALEFKRANESIARADATFAELHLLLEGEYGDAGLARAQRQQRAQLNPKDLGNLAQLAGLLIRDGQFDQASEIVDKLEGQVDDPRTLTPLRATLRIEQGDVEGARSIFARDIASRKPDERADAYLRLYTFLSERSRLNEAVTALIQALPWQKPDRMMIDKTLGDVFMSQGNFAGANASYTRIRDAHTAGDNSMWEQRRIETLIRLQRNDEAAEALAALPADQRTLSTRLLEADLTMRQGDYPKARQLLDAIVAENPKNSLVYVKRAEAMANAPELQRERLLDLDKAIELSPDFWQAYRARAGVLASMQRTDEAVADLRKAIELNPALDSVRISLIEYLVTQGRTSEALEIAREALNLKPRDTQLRDQLGLVFAQGGHEREAVQMYRSALELDPTPSRAVRVLDLLLNETPPRTVEAENLLALPIMTSLIEQDGGLRLMRAKVYHLQGRSDAALREAVEAYRSLRPVARDMLVWFNFVDGMIDDRTGTLDFLRRFEAEPGTSEWAKLFRGLLLISADDTRDEGMALLESHASTTADSEVAFTAWRALGSQAYESKDYPKAIEFWQHALDRRPDDSTVLNNMAFTYTARLGDPSKALPLAQKAAQMAPNDSDVLHTLGLSLLRNSQAQESLAFLERARASAQSPKGWLTSSIHFAEALNKVGRDEDAHAVLKAIQSRMDDPTVLNDVLQEDYNRLLAALGQN